MGVWQMAPQKLGCSCQTHMPTPATTRMAATTAATTAVRRPRRLGAGEAPAASGVPAITGSCSVAEAVVGFFSSLMVIAPFSRWARG